MLALPTVTIKFQKWERGVPKKTRLYDIPLRNYPSQRGDTFRSLQVFKCWVCNALTNKVVMGGYPGYGVRAICPNSSECWHHELEDKLMRLNKSHPQSYEKELQKEIGDIKRLHEKDVKNDLEGNPDMNLRRPVTNTRSFKPGSNCKHY